MELAHLKNAILNRFLSTEHFSEIRIFSSDFHEKNILVKLCFLTQNIFNVKPGFSGLGSVVFRDEENLLSNSKITINEYYAKYISTYKGELEIWCQKTYLYI